MINTPYISLSRQTALQRELDVVANNVANMNTTGFKGERMVFQDLVEKLQVEGGKAHFVTDRATYTDHSAGALTTTGNPYDVAIQGNGMFAVETPGGAAYTRDGRFAVSAEGDLVTQSGNRVLDAGGASIQLPEGYTSFTVSGDGTVSVNNGQMVGRLAAARFENPASLVRQGDGLFMPARGQEPVVADQGGFVQGMVEGSNVNPVAEMVRMVGLHRAYEESMRMSDQDHERVIKMIETVGRSA
jgi:flagellar basal-body rod protein FlgF